jgi:hypothetical protein
VPVNADELRECTRPQSGENICIRAENSSRYSQYLSADLQNVRSGGIIGTEFL